MNEKLGGSLRVKKLGKKMDCVQVSVSSLELSAVIPTFQEPGRLSHADAKALSSEEFPKCQSLQLMCIRLLVSVCVE